MVCPRCRAVDALAFCRAMVVVVDVDRCVLSLALSFAVCGAAIGV